MTEREWIEKIKKECVLNVGNFDTRYAIQLVGRRNSKIGLVSLNKRFMSVDVIDRDKYERFYDKFYSRNNKESRAPNSAIFTLYCVFVSHLLTFL